MKSFVKKIPGARKLVWFLREYFGTRSRLLRLLPKNGVGAEIGVHLGDFSERILCIAQPRKLFLIDPWRYEESDEYKDSWYGGDRVTAQDMDDRYKQVQARFGSEVSAGKVVVVRKDSADGLRDLPDESLDFTYIDGNHLYEFVKIDLELSFQKVRSGGFITGDDYLTEGWWEGGVKKAVDEFAQSHAVSIVWIKNGQFVLRKK